MNWNTIDQRCESTPFKLIDFGNRYRIELYHSLRAGTYGYQVYAVWVDYKHKPVYNDTGDLLYHETEAYFYKTDGYGYCKPSAALEHVFRAIGHKPKGFDLGATDDLHQYRKGGNYHKVPQSHLRKA